MAKETSGEDHGLVVKSPIALKPEESRDMSIEQARLAGRRWALVELHGQAGTGGTMLHLRFDSSESRVAGFAGCNQLSGSFQLGGRELTISSLATTRKYCRETMELERKFLEALQQTRQARVAGDVLELLDEAGAVLARLQAAE